MTSLKSKSLAFCLAMLGACGAWAQAWPPATVRVVVPYAPGSELDVLARDLSAGLAKQTGKTFVVENKPGANSVLGTAEVAKGEGDGSVLLVVDRLAVVTNPVLYHRLPYKWEESLQPVTDLANVRLYLAVRSEFPAKNYAEFLAYAKAHPGRVTVGTGGNGHVNHIGMGMVAQAHGLSWNYIPYRGAAPAIAALSSGEVDAAMAGGLLMQSLEASKRIRVLAVGDDKRSMVLPDVPTLAQAGGAKGSIPTATYSVFAPSKVPAAMVQQINAAIAKVIEQPGFKGSYAVRGLEIGASSPAQMTADMKRDAAKYGQIIRHIGITLE